MKVLQRLFSLILLLPITLAGWLLPRQPKTWALLLERHQPLEGNLRTLGYFLAQKADVRLFLLNHRDDQPALDGWPSSVTVVQGGSWAEIRARLAARQVIFTHGRHDLLGRFRWLKGVRFINVFHGIPIKGMGNLEPGFPRKKLIKHFREGLSLHTFCVSSALERTFFSAAYMYDANRVLVTGVPRNDMLLDSRKLDPRQRAIVSDIQAALDGKKMVLYAPTFRDYNRQALAFTRDDLQQIAALMRASSAVFAIRPHPRDVQAYESLIADLPDVILANSTRWEDSNAVLAASHLLISDYSSIWLDYLLLNRPLIGHFWDYDAYMKQRGFMFDFLSIFPSPVTRNTTQLLTQIQATVEQNWQISSACLLQHQRIKTLFHLHQDGLACERIYLRAMQT